MDINSLMPLFLLNKGNDNNSFMNIVIMIFTLLITNSYSLKRFFKLISNMVKKPDPIFSYNLSFKLEEITPNEFSNGKIHMVGSKKTEALIWYLSEEIKNSNIAGLKGLREFDIQCYNDCYDDYDNDSYRSEFELKVMPTDDCFLQIKSNHNIFISWRRCLDTNETSSSKDSKSSRKIYILTIMSSISDSYIMNWVEETCEKFIERERSNIKGKVFAFKLKGFRGHDLNPDPFVSINDISKQSGQYRFEDQLIEKNQKNKLDVLLSNFTNSNKKKINDANTLGLFLYGPPGTGKSSLIKSICGKLKGYHLLIIKPDLIETTNQLDNIFYFKELNGMPIPSSKIIIVIEDADRLNTKVFKKEKNLVTNNPDEYDIINNEDFDTYKMDNEDNNSNSNKNRKFRKRRQNRNHNNLNYDILGINLKKNTEVSKCDWLNVLQGPIDGQGRVIIFSANNPNSFDKAVTRSGRIDAKIYMGPLNYYNLEKLLADHYDDESFKLDESLIQQLDKKWKVSDAKDICKQFNKIESALDFLINKNSEDLDFIIE